MRDEKSLSESEPIENTELSHARIQKILGLLVVTGTILTGVLVSLRFGVGFLVGGLFSFVNYYWMKTTLNTSIEMAVAGKATKYMGIRFVIKYFLFGLLMAGVYFTGIVPVIAVILGVTGFALAVFLEGVINIFQPAKV